MKKILTIVSILIFSTILFGKKHINPNGHPFTLNISTQIENSGAYIGYDGFSIDANLPIASWITIKGGFFYDRYCFMLKSRGIVVTDLNLSWRGINVMAGNTEMVMSSEEIVAANAELEGKSTEEVLEWAMGKFGARLALSSSFGAEDVALIDMMWRIDPSVRVFTLETLRLHTETYTVMDQIRARYGIELEAYYPDMEQVNSMVRDNGFNLFYKT